MKIRFLGTASAEGMPAVFCNCDACMRAKIKGGRNIRTRSQVLLDEQILLDFPMDTYFHMINFSLDLSRVSNVFITHAHMDHCYPMEFALRGAPFAHNMSEPTLNIYGNETVIKHTEQLISHEIRDEIKKALRLNAIKPYQSVKLKNHTLTALPAVHTIGEDCYIYMIESLSGKTYLQFNDSGILPDAVYEFIAKRGIKLDLISYDCTYGYFEKGAGRHMGVLDNLKERARMEQYKIITPATRHILTHFSHNGGMIHDELCEKVKGLNFTVAYDGMEIEI